FHVHGSDQAAIERELADLGAELDEELEALREFSGDTKARYQASQQLVPIDVAQKLAALELQAEDTSQAMEEKQREQKRAKTTRTDYLADVDELQAWTREAELKVQDRSCEPSKMMENLRQIQTELAPMSDKLERLTKNGKSIAENTRDEAEKEMVGSTVANLTEQLAQVKAWLEEKKQQVGDTLDAWQRFLALLETVKAWTAEKRVFLAEPLKLASLNQARQRLHEYSTAVKSCKQVNKNLSDMGRELEGIGQVTSVGDLPHKLTEAEEAKVEVEGQLLERNALLQETSEEWEQCERKMKDVKVWMDKARQNLESPQNKKKPLRDQHAIREKMLSDVAIQKTKIAMSVEKLQVHFRSGIGGDSRVVEAADEILAELDVLNETVKEQTASLEACLAQLDQYQQEIQQLRQQIVQVEQQLRTVLSPTYLPNDREKALQEQQALRTRLDEWRQRTRILEDQIHAVDPHYVPPNPEGGNKPLGLVSYADIAAGRSRSSSRHTSPYRKAKEEAPATARVQSQSERKPVAPLLSSTKASQGAVKPHVLEAKIKSTIRAQTHAETPKQKAKDNAQVEKQQNKGKPETAARRGRSPTRKMPNKQTSKIVESAKIRVPSVQIEVTEAEVSKVPIHTEEKPEVTESQAQKSLAPREERRGRSPSPMWIPGSTTYADVLRGRSSRASSEPDERVDEMVHLKMKDSRMVMRDRSPTKVQESHENKANVHVESSIKETVSYQPTVPLPAQTAISRTDVEVTSWADEPLEDYNTLTETTVPPQQEMYNYMHPMPELVGFINSPLNPFPVNTFIYGQTQPVQPLDPIALRSYETHVQYAGEHFVAQSNYIPPEIYQQTRDVHESNVTTKFSNAEPIILPQRSSDTQSNISSDSKISNTLISTADKSHAPAVPSKTEQVYKESTKIAESNANKKVDKKNIQEVERQTKATDKHESFDQIQSQGSSFSYAQMLSRGLTPRELSFPAFKETDKIEGTLSVEHKSSSSVSEKPISSITEKQADIKGKTENWDVIKKKDVKRKQHIEQPSKKDESFKNSKKIKAETQKVENLQAIERQSKKDAAAPQKVKSLTENVNDNQIKCEKTKEVPREDRKDIHPANVDNSTEKKKKQKKKKQDKSSEDEIDKALKEIEDMDKHKTKTLKDKSIKNLHKNKTEVEAEPKHESNLKETLADRSTPKVSSEVKELKTESNTVEKNNVIDPKSTMQDKTACENNQKSNLQDPNQNTSKSNKKKSKQAAKENKPLTEELNIVSEQKKPTKRGGTLSCDQKSSNAEIEEKHIEKVTDTVVKDYKISETISTKTKPKIQESSDSKKSEENKLISTKNVGDSESNKISKKSEDLISIEKSSVNKESIKSKTCKKNKLEQMISKPEINAATQTKKIADKDNTIIKEVSLIDSKVTNTSIKTMEAEEISTKVEKIISLRPDNVEANLTTTYIVSETLQKKDLIPVLTMEETETKISTGSEYSIMVLESDEEPLFGSVQNRKKTSIKAHAEVNEQNIDSEQFNKDSLEKIEKDKTNAENSKVSQDTSDKLPREPYINEIIKPYQLDYHTYAKAENDLHSFYKIEKVLQEPQPLKSPGDTKRALSIERIVQQSKMKEPENTIKSESTISSTEIFSHELTVDGKELNTKSKDLPVINAPKNRLKTKDDVVGSGIQLKASELDYQHISNTSTSQTSLNVHLKSDDTWMNLLDEPITIDDDFDTDISNNSKEEQETAKAIQQQKTKKEEQPQKQEPKKPKTKEPVTDKKGPAEILRPQNDDNMVEKSEKEIDNKETIQKCETTVEPDKKVSQNKKPKKQAVKIELGAKEINKEKHLNQDNKKGSKAQTDEKGETVKEKTKKNELIQQEAKNNESEKQQIQIENPEKPSEIQISKAEQALKHTEELKGNEIKESTRLQKSNDLDQIENEKIQIKEKKSKKHQQKKVQTPSVEIQSSDSNNEKVILKEEPVQQTAKRDKHIKQDSKEEKSEKLVANKKEPKKLDLESEKRREQIAKPELQKDKSKPEICEEQEDKKEQPQKEDLNTQAPIAKLVKKEHSVNKESKKQITKEEPQQQKSKEKTEKQVTRKEDIQEKESRKGKSQAKEEEIKEQENIKEETHKQVSQKVKSDEQVTQEEKTKPKELNREKIEKQESNQENFEEKLNKREKPEPTEQVPKTKDHQQQESRKVKSEKQQAHDDKPKEIETLEQELQKQESQNEKLKEHETKKEEAQNPGPKEDETRKKESKIQKTEEITKKEGPHEQESKKGKSKKKQTKEDKPEEQKTMKEQPQKKESKKKNAKEQVIKQEELQKQESSNTEPQDEINNKEEPQTQEIKKEKCEVLVTDKEDSLKQVSKKQKSEDKNDTTKEEPYESKKEKLKEQVTMKDEDQIQEFIQVQANINEKVTVEESQSEDSSNLKKEKDQLLEMLIKKTRKDEFKHTCTDDCGTKQGSNEEESEANSQSDVPKSLPAPDDYLYREINLDFPKPKTDSSPKGPEYLSGAQLLTPEFIDNFIDNHPWSADLTPEEQEEFDYIMKNETLLLDVPQFQKREWYIEIERRAKERRKEEEERYTRLMKDQLKQEEKDEPDFVKEIKAVEATMDFSQLPEFKELEKESTQPTWKPVAGTSKKQLTSVESQKQKLPSPTEIKAKSQTELLKEQKIEDTLKSDNKDSETSQQNVSANIVTTVDQQDSNKTTSGQSESSKGKSKKKKQGKPKNNTAIQTAEVSKEDVIIKKEENDKEAIVDKVLENTPIKTITTSENQTTQSLDSTEKTYAEIAATSNELVKIDKQSTDECQAQTILDKVEVRKDDKTEVLPPKSKAVEVDEIGKLSTSYAEVAAKKSLDLADNLHLEQNNTVIETNTKPSIEDKRALPQIQVVSEEGLQPIENVVQVHDQGFMEFVNRKELRSRRSRSRSRSLRRSDHHETDKIADSPKPFENKKESITSKDLTKSLVNIPDELSKQENAKKERNVSSNVNDRDLKTSKEAQPKISKKGQDEKSVETPKQQSFEKDKGKLKQQSKKKQESKKQFDKEKEEHLTVVEMSEHASVGEKNVNKGLVQSQSIKKEKVKETPKPKNQKEQQTPNQMQQQNLKKEELEQQESKIEKLEAKIDQKEPQQEESIKGKSKERITKTEPPKKEGKKSQATEQVPKKIKVEEPKNKKDKPQKQLSQEEKRDEQGTIKEEPKLQNTKVEKHEETAVETEAKTQVSKVKQLEEQVAKKEEDIQNLQPRKEILDKSDKQVCKKEKIDEKSNKKMDPQKLDSKIGKSQEQQSQEEKSDIKVTIKEEYELKDTKREQCKEQVAEKVESQRRESKNQEALEQALEQVVKKEESHKEDSKKDKLGKQQNKGEKPTKQAVKREEVGNQECKSQKPAEEKMKKEPEQKQSGNNKLKEQEGITEECQKKVSRKEKATEQVVKEEECKIQKSKQKKEDALEQITVKDKPQKQDSKKQSNEKQQLKEDKLKNQVTIKEEIQQRDSQIGKVEEKETQQDKAKKDEPNEAVVKKDEHQKKESQNEKFVKQMATKEESRKEEAVEQVSKKEEPQRQNSKNEKSHKQQFKIEKIEKLEEEAIKKGTQQNERKKDKPEEQASVIEKCKKKDHKQEKSEVKKVELVDQVTKKNEVQKCETKKERQNEKAEKEKHTEQQIKKEIIKKQEDNKVESIEHEVQKIVTEKENIQKSDDLSKKKVNENKDEQKSSKCEQNQMDDKKIPSDKNTSKAQEIIPIKVGDKGFQKEVSKAEKEMTSDLIKITSQQITTTEANDSQSMCTKATLVSSSSELDDAPIVEEIKDKYDHDYETIKKEETQKAIKPVTLVESTSTNVEPQENSNQTLVAKPSLKSGIESTTKPKVTFYIDDEMVVVSQNKIKQNKDTPDVLRGEKLETLPSWSMFIAEESGFWPNKHAYEEAERELFEALAREMKIHKKQQAIDSSKNDSNDKDDPSGNSGKGGKSDSFNESQSSGSNNGTPRTERLVADLPGGIGSWSDYSTYLSLEKNVHYDDEQEALSENTNLPKTIDPYPDSSNSYSDQPLSSSDPYMNLGKKASSSIEMQDNLGETEIHDQALKTQENITLTIKEKMKHNIDDLQLVLAQLEGALRSLPRDSLQTMISALSTILADLRYYNQEASRIDNEIKQVPQDVETKKLETSIGEIRKSLAYLLSQAEQGQSTLEEARETQEKRKQEIRAYKQCLEETETWIRHVKLTINDERSTLNYKALQEEISFRLQQLTELESMTEISELARNLKEALQDLANHLLRKQQQMADENEPLVPIETASSVDATLDQESSVHSSLEDKSPSLADVSLQTGQSLIQDVIVEQSKPEQLTKQTSTSSIPVSTACQTFESVEIPPLLSSYDNPQIQETIKVVKSTDGKHDVIEIATKNIVPLSSQEQVWREQLVTNPEDIVVDMKYQDAQKQENVTSELNIQHAAPQSFETVLVEPDDVTTEVVVDSDGTKRIIVRKLRRTLVTSRQTMHQHVSQMSTAVGDGPPVVQAFSEATMRGQQVTVTTTKPDGTVEMATKQTYGGKVMTGTPGDQLNVEEYEGIPQYSHRIIQGDIKDLSPKPADVDDALIDGGAYRTQTSTVHAVVQQVTRKVIRKTRRIIRKVTIIDGKEVTSEEVVEEPEEVEIDEENIPHISINVVKSGEQGTFETSLSQEKQEQGKTQVIELEVANEQPQAEIPVQDSAVPKTTIEPPIIGEMQETPDKQKSKKPKKKKSRKSSATPPDSLESDKTYTIEEKIDSSSQVASEIKQVSIDDSQKIVGITDDKIKPHVEEKHEHEYGQIEVTIPEQSSVAIESQQFIDSEKCAVLQTPFEQSIESTSKDVSSLESTTIEDIPTITKASCKFEETPVGTSFETHVKLESGTVDVEQHTDVIDRSTVDIDHHFQSDLTDIPQKEDYMMDNANSLDPSIKSETAKLLMEERKRFEYSKRNSENKENVQVTNATIEPSIKYSQVGLQTEHTGKIQSVDISLSIENQKKTDTGPTVSVESHIEHPGPSVLTVSEENVNITLPPEVETVKHIYNKIIQTSSLDSPTTDKESDTTPTTPQKEKESVQKAPEISEINTPISRKSRKKKKHREKKDNETLSDEESSGSVVTTTIADSVELDVPHSDSSKHITEQPQPDVYEVAESSETFSAQKDESPEGDGYEADHRTTVEEISTEFDIDAKKKKKKRKKKQKARTSKEEDSEILKSIIQAEPKQATTIDDALPESSNLKTNEADTQTAVETRDVSVGELVPPITEDSVSPIETPSKSEKISKLEREMQTLKVEETNTEIQTSPRPGKDTGFQTCLDLKPNSEDTAMQTKTPDIVLTGEIALQTTPREEKSRTPIPTVPSLEADTQTTTTQVENLEIQTSPTESNLITEETEVQTSTEFLTNTEQQTTPPPDYASVLEEIAIQTQSPEFVDLIENSMQTSAATSPENVKIEIEKEDIDVQTNPIEEAQVNTIETQTTPKATTPELETQEIEIQTSPIESPQTPIEKELLIQSSVEEPKLLVEGESQTSSPEQKITSELSIQTMTHEIVPTIEESIQSVPNTTEISSQTVPDERKIEILDLPTLPSRDEQSSLGDTVSEPCNVKIVIEESEKVEQVDQPDIGISPDQDSLEEDVPSVLSESEKIVQLVSPMVEIQNVEESKPESDKVTESGDLSVQPKESEIIVKSHDQTAKDKTPDTSISETKSISQEVSSTPDTSYEIQIEATVEVCGSTTPDSTSQDTTIIEEPSEEEALKAKRQKRKRHRHRTVEIRESIPTDDKSSFESIFEQPLKTPEAETSLKLPYSEVAKSNTDNKLPSEPMGTSEEPLLLIESGLAKREEAKHLSSDLITAEKNSNRVPQLEIIHKTESIKLILENIKDSQKLKPSHLSNVLHISTLENSAVENSFENKASAVHKDLKALKNAVEEKNIVIIEETFITVVETISTWLETIESRIFLGRECPSGPSPNDTKNFVELKEEVHYVEEKIKELNSLLTEVENSYLEEERERIRQCVEALESQAKAIEEVAIDGETHVKTELARWDEFLNGVNNVAKLIEKQKKQLESLIDSEAPTVAKLENLDIIDSNNRDHMREVNKLFAEAKVLLRDYPGKEIPEALSIAEETTEFIEHTIIIERDSLLELLSLTGEYEQTLHEFSQITKIAENLLDSPISVSNLQHLQDEMQKHRKFFVNLNHCRAILESLEDNLDPETKQIYSELHEGLHSKAMALLDQAASKAQQMSLAASRWVVLEQGIKEERGWLQVAHQRVPDLQNVTSNEYDQYISLYQNLSLDIANHHGRILQLLDLARNIQNLIDIEDPDDCYGEALEEIVRLQETVDFSLRLLLAFRDSWSNQEMLVNRLENWMSRAERELATVNDPTGGHMRQFWELRAQYEVHNNMRKEAGNCFEQALRLVPLSDEMLQRQYHGEMQKRWNSVSDKIKSIQDAVRSTITSEDVPVNDKLNLLERELNELRITIDEFHGVMKTVEELHLYIERISVLFERVCVIQDELGRLGLLLAAESELVGFLLSTARHLESLLSEELDAAQLLRERLQSLKRGISRIRKAHQRQSIVLDHDVVAAAVKRCQSVGDELAQIWQEIMGLRQMLHTLPTSMRISVSPVGMERDISGLQDRHEQLEARCVRLLGLLKGRLGLWRRFEKQLEMVQQSVQETDYMMELLTVQGTVDYERLLKATERLEVRDVFTEMYKTETPQLADLKTSEFNLKIDRLISTLSLSQLNDLASVP
ncbi:hypothetical protein TSAR_015301, partial [Trichomalopsis sarcophagae]